MKANIYCGYYRETIIKQKLNILDIDIFEIPCLECNGTGRWNFMPEYEEIDCVQCKGTGKQYIS